MRSGNIFSHLMLCYKLQQSITGNLGSHFWSGLLKKVFVKKSYNFCQRQAVTNYITVRLEHVSHRFLHIFSYENVLLHNSLDHLFQQLTEI